MSNWKIYGLLLGLGLSLTACGEGRQRGGGGQMPEPEPTAEKIQPQILGWQFYIENSGSMLGYFKGDTEFREALLELATRSENLNKRQQFNYINDKAYSIADNQREFIAKFNEETARKTGKTSDSRLAEMIELVGQTSLKTGQIGVLASDFIFSIKGNDPKKELLDQKYIVNASIKKLAAKDYGVLVLQLQSNFEGTYFDFRNKRSEYRGKRPFYIWFIGPQAQVSSLMERLQLKKLKGYLDFALFVNALEQAPYASILPQSLKVGSYNRPRGAKGPALELENLKADARKGEAIELSLALDLQDLGMSESYLAEPANYRLTVKPEAKNAWSLREVKPLKLTDVHNNDRSLVGTANYLLSLRSEGVFLENQNLELCILKQMPAWVEASHSDDDSQIVAQTRRTFGLKYLMEGLGEAYSPPGQVGCRTNWTLSLKR